MSDEQTPAAPAKKSVRMKRQHSPCDYIRTSPLPGGEPVRRRIDPGQVIETDQANAELMHAREPEHWQPIGWKPRDPAVVLEEAGAAERKAIEVRAAAKDEKDMKAEAERLATPIQI